MGKTILLVEDNEYNMKLFSLLLTKSAYTVLEVRTGKQAIAMAKTEKPDLILLDIGLPDIDGLEAAKILKADSETKTIPIIALTAYAMDGDEKRIIKAGCDGYLSKPIEIPKFLETVQRFLS